jgi:glycosyltransferase involved in cell wall biosynthesis
VPDEEVPPRKKNLLKNGKIRIMFAGHVNHVKGITYLIDACKILDKVGIDFELNIIGKEENDISKLLDSVVNKSDIRINRYGSKDHNFILSKMKDNDIFCYPTFHSGEGHSNAINEAMMNTMVIISTRNGFLGDILSESSAYFVNERSSKDIYKTILNIINNREYAAEKANEGYNTLNTHFTVSKVAKDILNHYNELVLNN